MLNQTIHDIKTLKIQGAGSVATAALTALRHETHKIHTNDKQKFLKELEFMQQKLIATRPTEPKMRNSMKFVMDSLKAKTVPQLRKEVVNRIDQAIMHFRDNGQHISHIGSLMVKKNMVIATHCHSSRVVGMLKYAHNKGKHFYVHNTETRPLFQGRRTAKELADAGIPVQHYVDSAAMVALKDADMLLMGADAITAKGEVINKIGSRLFAEVAEFHGTHVYICADSWTYDPETKYHSEVLELRDPSEVWEHPPHGVKVINPAFEVIPPELIDGVISEFGVYKPEHFLYMVRRHYKWLK
jgi:ribose 1,5-bisphosphate isomerase